MKNIILVILATLIFAGVFIYNVLTWGLVLYNFWEWFMLPLFTDLPIITYYQAIGLMMVISLFRPQNTQLIKDEYRNEDAEGIAAFITPWVVLTIGYLTFIIFCK